MTEKYMKVSDIKKKLNYIYRKCGVCPQMKQTISNVLTEIPYVVKGESETALKAAPVEHGEWIKRTTQDRHECSCCHSPATITIAFTEYLSDYCPNCGAKMENISE